jgi:Flp pilus assembly protein TadD
MALSADGRQLAATNRAGAIKIWNTTTTELLESLQADAVSLAFHPRGQRLALAGLDGLVRVLETATGRVILTLRGHIGPATTAVYGRDGRWILSGGLDGTIRRWHAEGGGASFTFHDEAEAPPVTQVVSSDDGRLAFSVSDDGTWTMWDMATGRALERRRWADGALGKLALSPDGRSIVRFSGNSSTYMSEGLTIWDVDHQTEIRTLRAHHGPIADVAFSPDGRRIASAGRDYSVRFWDRSTGEEVFGLHGLGSSVMTLAFSADGRRFAAGLNDGRARVWDATPVRPDPTASALRGGGTAAQLTGASTPPDAASRSARQMANLYANQAYHFAFTTDPVARDTTRALAWAKKAVTLNPRDAWCRGVLGLIHGLRGDWDEALKAHERVLELELELEAGDRWRTCNNLAWAMTKLPASAPRYADTALELARRAVALRPESPDSENTLGVARYRAGDWQGAIETLTKAEEMAPDRPLRFNGFFLAMAYWQLGHRDNARRSYDRSVTWMEKNARSDAELIRIRAEAEALLGLADLPANVFVRP